MVEIKIVTILLLVSLQNVTFAEYTDGSFLGNNFFTSIYNGPVQEILDEAEMEATKLINKYGYPAENHTVQTKDGYHLVIHRIPYGKDGKSTEKRIPVLLVHGLNCASTQWFDAGRQSLGFVLADNGYDIWIANMRGGPYTNHSTLKRSNKKFWDFSFEEQGLYDLPATIDYILSTTEYEKLFYIGQSMGTTVLMVLLSEKPEYNNKLIEFIALTPAVYAKYITSLLRPIITRFETIGKITDYFGVHSVLQMSPLVKKLSFRFCPSSNPSLCEIGMHVMTGYDPYLRNSSRIPIYGVHCSVGTAKKILVQLSQYIKTGKPTKFNYGEKENLVRYNSVNPPEFDLSKITVPTVIFYCANDALISPLDVAILKRNLPNVIGYELYPHPMAIHSDINLGSNSKELAYNKIMDYMAKEKNKLSTMNKMNESMVDSQA